MTFFTLRFVVDIEMNVRSKVHSYGSGRILAFSQVARGTPDGTHNPQNVTHEKRLSGTRRTPNKAGICRKSRASKSDVSCSGHPTRNQNNVTKCAILTLHGLILSRSVLLVPNWSLMTLRFASLPPSVNFDSRTVSMHSEELPTFVQSGGDKHTIRGNTFTNNFLRNLFLIVPTLW